MDALYNRCKKNDWKRVWINCGKPCCLIGRCPEPLNLKRIFSNIEKFKTEKAERSSNTRWRTKGINPTELQPSLSAWVNVYEVIVTEALLEQCDANDKQETPTHAVNTANAFSDFEDCGDDTTSHAFKISVGDGDPDVAEFTFNSLFDIMVNPSKVNMNEKDHF